MANRPPAEHPKIAIRAVGLATAQGTSRDLLAGSALSPLSRSLGRAIREVPARDIGQLGESMAT